MTRSAGRDSPTSNASTDGLRCCRVSSRCSRRCDDVQLHGFKAPVRESVAADVDSLHRVHGPGYEVQKLFERQLEICRRWLWGAARVRMIRPHDGEDPTVGRQRAAAFDLCEVLDRRNFVAAARVVCSVAGGDGLHHLRARADEQPAALTWGVSTRVLGNGIQYGLTDPHVASVAGSLQASGLRF